MWHVKYGSAFISSCSPAKDPCCPSPPTIKPLGTNSIKLGALARLLLVRRAGFDVKHMVPSQAFDTVHHFILASNLLIHQPSIAAFGFIIPGHVEASLRSKEFPGSCARDSSS